jgi:hypothetical protein
MRLYVVKLTRLRDQFTQYASGAVHLNMAEDSAKDLIADMGKRCREDLKPAGSRTWRNSVLEVSIEVKKAPFKIAWERSEWTRDKL